jgi:hypothetical protein
MVIAQIKSRAKMSRYIVRENQLLKMFSVIFIKYGLAKTRHIDLGQYKRGCPLPATTLPALETSFTDLAPR